MIYKIEIKKEVEVKYLQAFCGVRYWEDAKVNGKEDTDGKMIPCRSGDDWEPLICLETGVILNWEQGKTADIHYKICDAGAYSLLDADKNKIKTVNCYVPTIMCPEGGGFGDYVIMNIDENGKIAKWDVDLEEFQTDEDD